MSEVKRIGEKESYKITVNWIDEFAKKISTAGIYEKLIQPKTEKFATIEDKMEDIKARVGFNSIKRTSSDGDGSINIVASKKCKCGKEKCNCSKKKISKERLEKIQNVLSYISDMVAAEPHLLEAEVIARCNDNSDLGFSTLRVNMEKLSEFINSKKNKGSDIVVVKYNKPEFNKSISPIEDMAEYYQHSMPNRI